MKKQILFIHGGGTFKDNEDFYTYLKSIEVDPYDNFKFWGKLLGDVLGNDYDVLSPRMPIKDNADYEAWKIWFEKYLSFVKDETPILIGHSLGSTFLLKYLSENSFPKKILQLHLVSPAVIDEDFDLEKLATFEFDFTKINKIENFCNDINVWHSKDDDVVSFKNAEIVKENIPNIKLHVFQDRGHFHQESFPEIIKMIKELK